MDAPDIKTPLPGPKAKAIIDRDRQFVSPSYTRDYPFVIARGEGAVVEDVDGNRFLDCAAGIAVNSTGVSHPDVVTAICEQAQKFIHMSGTDFYYEPQVRLAEQLASIAPIDGDGPDVLRQLRHGSHRGGDQAGALSHEAAGHHRVSRRVPRTLAGIAVADREQGDPAPRIRSVHARRAITRPIRTRTASTGSADAVRGAVPVLHHAISSSCTWSLPTKSPPSSSSRFRAKAATSSRRRRSCRACGS